MKAPTYILLIVAVLTILLGIVLVGTGTEVPTIVLLPDIFLEFTQICLLFAIALAMVELLNKMKK